MKKTLFLSLCLSLFASTVFSFEDAFLVKHVQNSIANAEKGQSKLSAEVLNMEGMSSPKVRHLLNNLCSLPKISYLEIGCWKGSTWISSLYGNGENMVSAVAIDNWSEFGGPEKEFKSNCAKFLKSLNYTCYSMDCFSVNPTTIVKKPVNIYFFDGEHRFEDQERAFTHYDSVLERTFIAIVDDYNWGQVREGTQSAFKKLGYKILFEKWLPADFNGDREQWWNGLYIAVIKKTNSK